MTVISLSDYSCHSMIVNGVVKYVITENNTGAVLATLDDRERAKDLTRELQRTKDAIWR